jgi:bacterioferritin
VVSVIKGVIDAERGAIDHYTKLIKTVEGIDYVTQDMAIKILADEQDHLREFEGFLKEYEPTTQKSRQQVGAA